MVSIKFKSHMWKTKRCRISYCCVSLCYRMLKELFLIQSESSKIYIYSLHNTVVWIVWYCSWTSLHNFLFYGERMSYIFKFDSECHDGIFPRQQQATPKQTVQPFSNSQKNEIIGTWTYYCHCWASITHISQINTMTLCTWVILSVNLGH